MSVIGGPNNPISNGLVYALDFKNNRSYVSGSTSAKSLTFTTATATVTGSNIYQIPNLVNGLLQFNLGSSATTGSWIQIPTTFDSINSLGQFTILVTAEGKSDNNFLSDTSDTAYTRWGAGLGSQIGLGFGQAQSTQYGRGFTNPATSLSHIVYRYSSGSFTIFVNGFPISSSNTSFSQNRSQGGSSFLISGRHPQQDSLWSGSLGNVFIYNRALTNDEVRSNYTLASREYGLPTPPSFSIDENAYLFSQTANITSSAYITALDTFVRGLKSASLWDKMVGIYPFLGGNNTLNQLNLKESSLTVYPASFTGSWSSSFSGSKSNTTASYATLTGLTPSTYHPLVNTQSFHMAYLSYDTPATSGSLMGAITLPASGGLVTISGSRVYHAFKTVGTSSFTPLATRLTNVEVMVVAGGGAGGGNAGGGGGAGGLIYSSSFSIAGTGSVQVIVGSGGSPLSGPTGNGENSRFGTIVSTGGGRGGDDTIGKGKDGGSGGGQGLGGDIGTGSLGQGNNGGYRTGTYGAGGGGGAGQSGSNGIDSNIGGPGGSGSFYGQFTSIGGSPAGWFAGGGGGGGNSGFGAGGIGGGGAGVFATGSSGSVNTGGGGGAGGLYFSFNGGAGGSGIVIVAYDLPTTPLTGSGTSLYTDGTSIGGAVNNEIPSTFSAGGPLGLVMTSRTGSRAYSVSKNKVIFNYTSSASSSISNNLLLNAVNLNGTASFPSQNNVAYASVGAGLSNDETRTYYDLVNTFQTNLGRFDLDAWNFIGNAQILDVTQQQAINTLVFDLKAYGIWDKMKAIYPFVGQPGVSSSFEVNLKEPTTFRGRFSGSWTFSSTGVTPDGSTGYMDTGLNPSGIINENSVSISTYLRTNANNVFCDIGASDSPLYQIVLYPRLSDVLYTDLGSQAAARITYANTDSRGHFISTRTSSTSFKSFINSTLKATLTTTQTLAIVTKNIFLGANNSPSGIVQHSPRQTAFAHIGDGLTDTEATNLYTAVQRFQTTLGRQV
jgi:hypothetical protein